jgi:hypothetical protein
MRCPSRLVLAVVLVGCGGDDGSLETLDGGTVDDGAATGTSTAEGGTTAGSVDGGSEAGSGASVTVGDSGDTGDTGGGGDDEPLPEEFAFCQGAPGGAVVDAGPADYRDAALAMQPGDTVRLAAGMYVDGLDVTDMNGSADACFVIEAADPANPPIFIGNSSRNTLSVRDSSYVVLRGMEVDGAGELGDGLKAEGDAMFAHHIVVEGLYIHDVASDMQIVGINTKCTTWNWVIRGNRIERVGTGMYLGGSAGDTPFIGGLIEDNVVLDTIGYNIQIKHQLDRPALVGVPEQATTVIRNNVWSKQNGASGGADARPNFLLGHFPATGPGADDLYVVYGNFFHDNPVEALVQMEGNVALFANVLVNPNGPAIRVQPHNDVPKRIDVFANTVVASGTGIGITGGDPGFTQRAVGNAVFAASFDGGEQIDNTFLPMADAATMLVDPLAPVGAGLDLHPLDGALAEGYDAAMVPDVLRADRDFDRRVNGGTHRGAYAGPADVGAWVLAREPKP